MLVQCRADFFRAVHFGAVHGDDAVSGLQAGSVCAAALDDLHDIDAGGIYAELSGRVAVGDIIQADAEGRVLNSFDFLISPSRSHKA